MSKVNRKNWPKYFAKVIHGFNIFFFRKVNNIVMRKFATLFI